MAIDEFDTSTSDLGGFDARFATIEDAIRDHNLIADELPFLRTAYNYDRDLASRESGLFCHDLSLTQQHMADDADINEIVRRFGITGQMPQGVRLPTYGDFVGVNDYRAALAAISEADDNFMQYPADLRARFDNDPFKFTEFVLDPASKEELYTLGLAERPRQAPLPSTDDSKAPPVPPIVPPVP